MSAPQALERHRGEIVWRTPEQVEQRRRRQEGLDLLGRQVIVTTRRNARRHVCTIVAAPEPDRIPGVGSGYERRWMSSLSRARYENSPRGHRHGWGAFVLRVEHSTAPNMVGRYLLRGAW